MIDALLIALGFVPILLALLPLARRGVAKYRRWRRRDEVPVIWFEPW